MREHTGRHGGAVPPRRAITDSVLSPSPRHGARRGRGPAGGTGTAGRSRPHRHRRARTDAARPAPWPTAEPREQWQASPA